MISAKQISRHSALQGGTWPSLSAPNGVIAGPEILSSCYRTELVERNSRYASVYSKNSDFTERMLRFP